MPLLHHLNRIYLHKKVIIVKNQSRLESDIREYVYINTESLFFRKRMQER